LTSLFTVLLRFLFVSFYFSFSQSKELSIFFFFLSFAVFPMGKEIVLGRVSAALVLFVINRPGRIALESFKILFFLFFSPST